MGKSCIQLLRYISLAKTFLKIAYHTVILYFQHRSLPTDLAQNRMKVLLHHENQGRESLSRAAENSKANPKDLTQPACSS